MRVLFSLLVLLAGIAIIASMRNHYETIAVLANGFLYVLSKTVKAMR